MKASINKTKLRLAGEPFSPISICSHIQIDKYLTPAAQDNIKVKWMSMKRGQSIMTYFDEKVDIYCNFSLQVALSIAVAAGGQCTGCGCKGTFDNSKGEENLMMSFDSIVSHKDGGWYIAEIQNNSIIKCNVQCLHYFCNKTKMQFSQMDYRKHLIEIKRIKVEGKHVSWFERYYREMNIPLPVFSMFKVII